MTRTRVEELVKKILLDLFFQDKNVDEVMISAWVLSWLTWWIIGNQPTALLTRENDIV